MDCAEPLIYQDILFGHELGKILIRQDKSKLTPNLGQLLNYLTVQRHHFSSQVIEKSNYFQYTRVLFQCWMYKGVCRGT
jgi:hypothetical protein